MLLNKTVRARFRHLRHGLQPRAPHVWGSHTLTVNLHYYFLLTFEVPVPVIFYTVIYRYISVTRKLRERSTEFVIC